jgi:hypothetical protein
MYRSVPLCSLQFPIDLSLLHWPLAFLGPKWHSPIGLMLFHRAQKVSNVQPPSGPSTCPRNEFARYKPVT